MLSSNGRASNRLVVGRGTDAGSGGRMPHRRSWRGCEYARPLARRAGPGGRAHSAPGSLGRTSGSAPAGADVAHQPGQQHEWGCECRWQQRLSCSELRNWRQPSGGYTVSEVDIQLATASGKSTSVKIRENNTSNQPGNLVETLTNPGTLTAQSLNTFLAQ